MPKKKRAPGGGRKKLAEQWFQVKFYVTKAQRDHLRELQRDLGPRGLSKWIRQALGLEDILEKGDN